MRLVDVALGVVHVNRFDFPGLYSSQDSWSKPCQLCSPHGFYGLVHYCSTIWKALVAIFESGPNIVVLGEGARNEKVKKNYQVLVLCMYV